MNVDLTLEQQDFIRLAVETGRVGRPEAAVQEAVALWVERERSRLDLLAAIDEADASLARGEAIVITKDSMKALAEEVKARGLARLAARRSDPE